MSYYKGNAIYNELIKRSVDHYKFVTGNAWQLIYGDANCNPLLLVYAFGVESNKFGQTISNKNREGIDFLTRFSEISGVPFIAVQFKTDASEVDGCLISKDGLNYQSKSMVDLAKIFSHFGLPISNNSTAKYLNDKTSSAYHQWQRNSLGSALIVSDVDLYKVNSENKPTTLYELKRSYLSIEKWEPFKADYNNFRLVSNFCNMVGLEFQVVYNVRHKNPFFDDPSKLKLFKVNFKNNPSVILDKVMTFDEFIEV